MKNLRNTLLFLVPFLATAQACVEQPNTCESYTDPSSPFIQKTFLEMESGSDICGLTNATLEGVLDILESKKWKYQYVENGFTVYRTDNGGFPELKCAKSEEEEKQCFLTSPRSEDCNLTENLILISSTVGDQIIATVSLRPDGDKIREALDSGSKVLVYKNGTVALFKNPDDDSEIVSQINLQNANCEGTSTNFENLQARFKDFFDNLPQN